MSQEQLKEVLKMIKDRPPPMESIGKLRDWFDKGSGIPFAESDFTYNRIEIGNFTGEVVGLLEESTDGLIIYFHGGGFVLGSSKSHRVITSLLCRETKSTVLVPDYRLAPEFVAPTAHEDAYSAYLWALNNGYSPERIALAGDSAGGNLALATALRAKKENLVLPSAIALLSPAFDFLAEGRSHREVSDDPIISSEAMNFFISTYLGNNRKEIIKFLTLLNEDLSGLPPTIIHVGTRERLLDDSVAIAQRLCSFGTISELKIWDGMFHVWQQYAHILDEGMQSIFEISDFLKKQFKKI